MQIGTEETMDEFEATQGNCVPTPPNYYDNGGLAKMASTPTMAQRLDLAVRKAEEQLAAAKEAREIFLAHPFIERLLNLMQRGHF